MDAGIKEDLYDTLWFSEHDRFSPRACNLLSEKKVIFNQAVHPGKEQGANYLNFILGIPEAWFVVSDINITWKTC